MATKQGFIKKTPLKEYDTARKSGLISITLKNEDDELIDVRLTNGDNDIVLVTREGLSITFNEKDVRPMGRTAQGVIGIRLNKDDYLVGMEPIINRKEGTLQQKMALEREQNLMNIEYKQEEEKASLHTKLLKRQEKLLESK